MSGDVSRVVSFALAVLNFGVATLLVLRGFAVSREIGAASVTAAAQSAHEELLDSRAGVSSQERRSGSSTGSGRGRSCSTNNGGAGSSPI